jgi:hypothetical protein
MNTLSTIAVSIMASVFGASLAWADDVPSPRVDARQDRQQERIEHGVANGQLTAPEARQLQRQQHRITRAEHRREADGTLSPRDKAALERKQDRASRHIHRLKHNASAAE